MKTNDLQELKPVYIHEASYTAGDEISLVDLAMVLVRRKVMIISIFIVFIVSGITLALLIPRTYTFSTTIEIGSQIISGSIKPFESPQALLAKLQYSYIPQILSEHKQSHPDDKNKYRINSSVPSGSNITLLEIKGTEDQADTLKQLLQITSQKAIEDHNRIFQSVKKNLETRLIQATNNLRTLRNSKNNETEVASSQSIIESLSSQLANLRNTREVLPPIRSLDPTGSGRKTIVIITAIAGIFLGVFAAFFAEFLSKVKLKIGEKGKD